MGCVVCVCVCVGGGGGQWSSLQVQGQVRDRFDDLQFSVLSVFQSYQDERVVPPQLSGLSTSHETPDVALRSAKNKVK